MSNTDRIRAYYNLHRKCFSVQDYQTGLVSEHTYQLFVTNAMFVVRKSGNERVKQEGKKNVHAFVNGIRTKYRQGVMPDFASYKVRYDPYTMDYFHYERIVNGQSEWLPIDRHWIGNVYLYMNKGKPIIYADIDKWSDTNPLGDDKSSDTKGKPVIINVPNNISARGLEKVDFDFLRKKRKQIENKKKLLAI